MVSRGSVGGDCGDVISTGVWWWISEKVHMMTSCPELARCASLPPPPHLSPFSADLLALPGAALQTLSEVSD